MRTKEVSSLQELISLTPGSTKLIFVADVGATNTRVSFIPQQITNTEILFFKSKAGSIQQMIDFFQRTAEEAGDKICSRIVASAIAIPGPITDGGKVTVIANFAAKDTAGRTLHVDQLPKRVCPLGRTTLLNDLHACASGIAALNHIGVLAGSFSRMWASNSSSGSSKNKSSSLPTNEYNQPSEDSISLGKGSVVVLAPGTGLGTALLYYRPDNGRFLTIPLEFGHVNLATFKEDELVRKWAKALGRGDEHPPEYDDTCSGRGLEFIYNQYLNKGNTSLPAPSISKLAREQGEPKAVKAFTIMYSLLMNLASNLSMGFVPLTVVIAGDNAVRHSFFLGKSSNVKLLHDEFLSHTTERMGFMSKVQCLRQQKEMNLNLIGAAFEASNRVQKWRRSHL